MHKLLLTSVVRPFGGPGEGDSVGAELFHAQVTRAQGPFSLRQVIRVWALDYIAENLETPTVTLHYPSERELIRELKAGDYTHVGINFVVATFHKVRRMVPLIRRYAPHAKIVLGGYGTVLPDAVLSEHSDAVCREEGIAFMRRLLGETSDRPIRHPHAPIPSVSVLGQLPSTVVGHVTAGLGCPNGCDFCCTSHFFDRKYVRFATRGRDIYEALLATQQRAEADGTPMESFILIDEDFFLHHKRAREFLECVREGGQAFSIMGFGSVRGLSRFDEREIAEMGFDLIWNAFEGTGAGYRKQAGTPLAELYPRLKSVGIAQLTSMIIGFPYQDEATIQDELEQLMELEPALTQCLIYFAFPGTPLHDQVIAESRYRAELRDAPDLRTWDGFTMHFDHPNIRPERIEELQREIYREDFRRLGPSVLRLGRVWLTGFENLKDDPNPLLRARAVLLRDGARAVLPTLSATMLFAQSSRVRQAARALRRDLIDKTGALTLTERAMEAGTPAAHVVSTLTRRLGILQQPGLLRLEHRMPGAAASHHTAKVARLMGGFSSGVLSALAEDVGERIGQLWRGVPETREAVDAIVTTRATGMQRSLPVIQGDSRSALASAEGPMCGPIEAADASHGRPVDLSLPDRC